MRLSHVQRWLYAWGCAYQQYNSFGAQQKDQDARKWKSFKVPHTWRTGGWTRGWHTLIQLFIISFSSCRDVARWGEAKWVSKRNAGETPVLQSPWENGKRKEKCLETFTVCCFARFDEFNCLMIKWDETTTTTATTLYISNEFKMESCNDLILSFAFFWSQVVVSLCLTARYDVTFTLFSPFFYFISAHCQRKLPPISPLLRSNAHRNTFFYFLLLPYFIMTRYIHLFINLHCATYSDNIIMVGSYSIC